MRTSRKPSVAFLILLLSNALTGQTPTRTFRPADSARRVALVIGNNAYPWGRLTNAASDARSLASALEQAGFDRSNVTLKTDLNLKEMQRTIRAFVETIRSGDLAFVYYSGHGVEVRGKNYLLPVDFPSDATELQVSDEAYSAQELLEKIEGSAARVKMIVFDACRDNPLKVVANRSAGSRGLGRMEGEGTLIMFATSAGKTATDSGVFQRELARGIQAPGIAADEALKRVARAVNKATDGRQTPALYGLLLEDFAFVSERPTADASKAPAPAVLESFHGKPNVASGPQMTAGCQPVFSKPIFNAYPVIWKATPGESGCNDFPTLAAGLQGSDTWSDELWPKVEDSILFRVYVSNSAGDNSNAVMKGVRVATRIDPSEGVVKTTLSADNAKSVSGTVRIHLPPGAVLKLIAGDPSPSIGRIRPIPQDSKQLFFTVRVAAK